MDPVDLENNPDQPQPMDDMEITQRLEQEYQASIGVENSEISEQRSDAMDRYLGEEYGNEVDGRSKVISRDVTDAVEWAMPQLVDVFFGSDNVVDIEPTGEEDYVGTELESKYLNYVFLKENNGFLHGYQFMKDALLQKDGIMKVWVEPDIIDEEIVYYEDLTEEELLMILQEQGVELLERTQDETGYFDVVVSYTNTQNKIKVAVIPPEEFKVSRQTRLNLQESPYVCHEQLMDRQEVRELLAVLESEYTVDECFTVTGQIQYSAERLARHQKDGTNPNEYHHIQECSVKEEYVLLDANGDGFAERMKYIRVGDKIVHREYYTVIPFAHCQAIILSHKFNGLSLADLVTDLAEIKTALQRTLLDNFYQSVNQRVAVLENQVNMEDLMISRPGGIVRENVSGAVRPLPATQLPPEAFSMLGYYDQVRDERTGISKMTQGLDPNALSSNVAASAVSQVMSAAQQRMKLIARVMAEGFRQVFWIMHEVSRQYISGPQKFALGGEFLEADPSRFLKRHDFTIKVGLGTQEKMAQMQNLNMIVQDMQMIAAQGGMGRIITEGNVYNLARKRAELIGEPAQMFYTDPATVPPPEPQPSPQEIQMQMFRIEKEQELALKMEELASKERIEMAKLERQDRRLDIEEYEAVNEVRLEEEQAREVSIE